MTNNLYCFYNVLSARYGDVFCYPSDDFCTARIRSLADSGKIDLKEIQVCRVGSINISSGIVSPCAPERLEIPVVADKMPVNPPEVKQ